MHPTASVLPLLVPGLTVGSDIKIKDFEFDPPISSTVTKRKRRLSSRTLKDDGDFGILTNLKGVCESRSALDTRQRQGQAMEDVYTQETKLAPSPCDIC